MSGGALTIAFLAVVVSPLVIGACYGFAHHKVANKIQQRRDMERYARWGPYR
jgi:hypothetical protein